MWICTEEQLYTSTWNNKNHRHYGFCPLDKQELNIRTEMECFAG